MTNNSFSYRVQAQYNYYCKSGFKSKTDDLKLYEVIFVLIKEIQRELICVVDIKIIHL